MGLARMETHQPLIRLLLSVQWILVIVSCFIAIAIIRSRISRFTARFRQMEARTDALEKKVDALVEAKSRPDRGE